jgi:hypothetical protein
MIMLCIMVKNEDPSGEGGVKVTLVKFQTVKTENLTLTFDTE